MLTSPPRITSQSNWRRTDLSTTRQSLQSSPRTTPFTRNITITPTSTPNPTAIVSHDMVESPLSPVSTSTPPGKDIISTLTNSFSTSEAVDYPTVLEQTFTGTQPNLENDFSFPELSSITVTPNRQLNFTNLNTANTAPSVSNFIINVLNKFTKQSAFISNNTEVSTSYEQSITPTPILTSTPLDISMALKVNETSFDAEDSLPTRFENYEPVSEKLTYKIGNESNAEEIEGFLTLPSIPVAAALHANDVRFGIKKFPKSNFKTKTGRVPPLMVDRRKLPFRNYRLPINKRLSKPKQVHPLASFKQRQYRNKLRSLYWKNNYQRRLNLLNESKRLSSPKDISKNHKFDMSWFQQSTGNLPPAPIASPLVSLSSNKIVNLGPESLSSTTTPVPSTSIPTTRRTKNLPTTDDKMSAVDAFMMIPLCAEVRKINQRKHYGAQSRNATEFYIRNKRRKMKMYKMLRRIMKPRFISSKSNTIHNMSKKQKKKRAKKRDFNEYFNKRLWRVLRRLFKRRKEKLRREHHIHHSWSRQLNRQRRVRKVHLIDSIRKYKLNRIFKLFKINIKDRYSQRSRLKRLQTPILCIAAKRITKQYESQRGKNLLRYPSHTTN